MSKPYAMLQVTEAYDFDGAAEKTRHLLTVGEQLVRDNFQRFGLLDEQVKFVKGYFNDTLPSIQQRGLKSIAVLRVDGDLYSSTMDVLKNLYPLVQPGGYIILDDWPFEASQNATADYLRTFLGLYNLIVKTNIFLKCTNSFISSRSLQ